MDIKIQKSIFLEKLKKEDTLDDDLKGKLEKQIEKMEDEEFVVFIESIKGVKNRDDLKEKIATTREAQAKEHKNFLRMANDFLKKTTQNDSKKQAESDELKINSLRDKIKSL